MSGTTPTPDAPRALQRVTDAALAHRSLDELLRAVLPCVAELVGADTAAFLLLDPRGRELVVCAASQMEEGARIPVGEGFAGRVAVERRALMSDDAGRSLLGVPLLRDGRLIGVLQAGSRMPFTTEAAELLELAGDRAAIAIDHARAYEAERDAVRQLRAVQRVADAALVSLSLDELLRELLERVTEILGADTAAFLLLEENELVARAAKGIEEEVEQGVRIPLGRGFAGRIAAQRTPVVIEDVDHADIFNPILREKGIRSLLGVPLLVERRVIGVLHVGTLTPRTFTTRDAELLQLAGERAAVAIERAVLYHQRGVVDALQRSLVPEDLPALPGFEVAARYQPAAVHGGIGGDWYDFFALPGGGAALVVGDVMGHGIAAAALMAQIRTGLRAYALDGHSPAGVLERLNRLATAIAPRQLITLVYAAVDLAEEKLRIASAGHLPPLLRLPDGETRLLWVEGDAPLIAVPTTHYSEHECEFPLGSTLVLVTDGAVEVRGESIDESLERLRCLVAGESDTERMCDAIVRGDVRGVPADDDVAVLVVRATPLGEALRTTWPANADALAELRPLLRRWLEHRGADAGEVYDITVSVQEAAANAVEHAFAPGAAVFDVEAAHDDGVITVTVRDRGRWRPPRGEHRGRGLPLMEALMDAVEVSPGEAGTRVVMRRRLGRIVA